MPPPNAMIRSTMKAHLTIPSLVAACLLASCATPRTSQGLIDANGDGLGEKVTVLERPQDQQTVLLHVEKIQVSQKILDVAELGNASLNQLHSAGRASSLDLMATEASVARAKIALIDAKLALARTGLLSSEQLSMLDTDGDGLPDMLHSPISASKLLDQKTELSLKLFEQEKTRHARTKQLHQNGRSTAAEVNAAQQLMYAAKLVWLDARMERDANSKK